MRERKLGQNRRALRRSVALSFPLAFALHDLEELLCAQPWNERPSTRARARSLPLPVAVADALPVTSGEMAVAVGIVASGVAAITASSVRNLDGDLRPLKAALAAFSAHSISHVGASIAFRGYTPGVATVPLVIVPYSLWAWPRVWRAGLVRPRREVARALATGAVLAMPLTLGAQVLAHVALRTRARKRAWQLVRPHR